MRNATIDETLGHYTPPESTWTEWQTCEPALSDYDFDEIRSVLLDRATPFARKNDILRALLERSHADSDADVAILCIIVCLLPGLKRTAYRYADVLRRQEVWAELTAALVRRVHRYDLGRRPNRIAANLLLDSAHDVVRVVRRESAWRKRVDLRDDATVDEPCVDCVESNYFDAAAEGGTLTQADATLIRATRLDGVRLVDIARLLGISYEAAKKRRQRAEALWVAGWRPEAVVRWGRTAQTASAAQAA